jgi:hypothetical protein
MADEISPNLTKLLADASHKKQVYDRLKTEFDAVATEYQLDARDKDTLTKALQSPPASLDVDLRVFLDALHQQGFVQLSWVGFKRFR